MEIRSGERGGSRKRGESREGEKSKRKRRGGGVGNVVSVLELDCTIQQSANTDSPHPH